MFETGGVNGTRGNGNGDDLCGELGGDLFLLPRFLLISYQESVKNCSSVLFDVSLCFLTAGWQRGEYMACK
jgi:hypothetical protein